MSKKAIVTGASSGIGRAIAETLIKEGYEVYGIGRSFREEEVEGLHAIEQDLRNIEDTKQIILEINRDQEIELIVNSAGVGYYGLHEEIRDSSLIELVETNLLLPMLITKWLLRTLKQNHGIIINVSSVTAEEVNAHGAAYGATKAGLTSFTRSIFQEARKHGVRCVNIEPDMTVTNLYRNASFEADTSEEAAYLTPEDVAECVKEIIRKREGMSITDIRLQPQLHRIRKK